MEYKIVVLTGDCQGAGTDANVWIILHDDNERKSPSLKLKKLWSNNFERGSHDDFLVTVPGSVNLGHIRVLEIWRDSSWIASSWFVDGINVFKVLDGDRSTFPVHRWIKSDHRYKIIEFGTSLPQFDADKSMRYAELEEKRRKYELNVTGIFPMQIREIPDDEKFSWDYKWDLIKKTFYLKTYAKYKGLFGSRWKDIDEIAAVYNEALLPRPAGIDRWNDDFYFGVQRVASSSISLISLCTEIPSKFDVTSDMLAPFLEGLNLQKALKEKRIFIVDLVIMDGLPCKDGFELCAPLALFFENSEKKLMPIAIQLKQQKDPKNPVFLPSDPPYTWAAAKMWYNNADSTWQQSCTHLLFTHLLMEGITVVTNRYLSPTHPIFRLLAPHFLYIIAINARGLNLFIGENMWADQTFSAGFRGITEFMKRGLAKWRMDVEGTLPESLKERGLLEEGVLSYYPFRDDALYLYKIIHDYTAAIVNLYYDEPAKLEEDWELQDWAESLIKPSEEGGLNFQGVPGRGRFTTLDQLITTVTSIIYTCSVGHSSVNTGQYDDYGFPLYFPCQLTGAAPTSKDALTMDDIMKLLPDKKMTIWTMIVTKILSDTVTNRLGDFEVTYMFDPPAKKILDEFRQDLQTASDVFRERNKTRFPPYTLLLPENISNSISI